jgi:hypothetical protein
MSNYYSVKNMLVPTPEIYQLSGGERVLLIGTARKQDWAVSIDIDSSSPCDVLANGLALPFMAQSFDVVILDYVTNFLPKEYMVGKLIAEAGRVGKKVMGRATVTPGKRVTLKGSKQRFSHSAYPSGVQWLRGV